VDDEELRVSGHADAVVAEAVEEQDGFSVWVMGADRPGAVPAHGTTFKHRGH